MQNTSHAVMAQRSEAADSPDDESSGRYEGIFSRTPPAAFAQFVERVPMVKGRLDRKASTATGYAWLIWDKQYVGHPHYFGVIDCHRHESALLKNSLRSDRSYTAVLLVQIYPRLASVQEHHC
jgi:hypothetical protein